MNSGSEDEGAPFDLPEVRRPIGVQVFNTHGAEKGRGELRPENLTASEFSAFTDLEWQEWTAESATGRGGLSGTWCLPGCASEPYRVALRLRDPAEIGSATYFTRFTVEPEGTMPPGARRRFAEAEGISGDEPGRLALPPEGE